MNDTPIRVRVTYSKRGNLRFIGHLDTQRMFERALRRTKLPLRYSRGFNKRLRINLASALPLGFTSRAEMLDFWMDEIVDEKVILERLVKSLPSEIEVTEVILIDNSLPSLQGSLLASDYEIIFSQAQRQQDIEVRFTQLLQKPELPVTRRGKTVDIKPMILQHAFNTLEDGALKLNLRLSSSATASARPDDLLGFLELDPAECSIVRVNLIFEE